MADCEHCGKPLPDTSRASRRFCSDVCRVQAHRARPIVILPELADAPDAVADAYLAPREPVEQLAAAVLHARSLTRVFLRLARVVPDPVAWRSANVGKDMASTLDENFPEDGDG